VIVIWGPSTAGAAVARPEPAIMNRGRPVVRVPVARDAHDPATTPRVAASAVVTPTPRAGITSGV